MKSITIIFNNDKINDMDKINIFNQTFVKRYKNKSKIIYNNKLYDLENEILIEKQNINKLKLKLLFLNHIAYPINFRDIIKGCSSSLEYIKNNDNIFPESKKKILPKMKYKINKNEKKEEYKIFGQEFVKNNNKNCLILFDNKIFPLKEYLSKDYIDIEIIDNLEIFMIALKKIENVRCMFDKCNTLEELSFNKKEDIKINEDKDSYLQKNMDEIYLSDLEFHENLINLDIFKNLNNIFYKELLPSTILPQSTKSNNIEIIKDIIISYFDNIKFLILFINYLSKENSIFKDIKTIIELSNITLWNIKAMDSMFSDCYSLISIPDISRWNTEKVNTMKGIFNNCLLLQYIPDISKWNTNNVDDISYMFYECNSLKSLPDLSKWKFNKKLLINLNYIDHIFH